MSTLNYTDIVNIINGGGVVFLDCGGVPKLIDSIPDIPPDLSICGFVERNLSEYIIVGSPANGQIPAYNSTTSKLQWTTPASGGGAWGTITGTLSNQTDLQTALNLKASINTTDGILPYKSGSGTLADSPITRIDASTIQVAAINGGSGANDDITIQGTSNATRTTSYVNLQPNGGNVGIGTTTPTSVLDLRSNYAVTNFGLGALVKFTNTLTTAQGHANFVLETMAGGGDTGFAFRPLGTYAWDMIFGTTGVTLRDAQNSFLTALQIDAGTRKLGINSAAPAAQLDVRTSNAGTIGAIVQGASAQTANLMEWRNSAGTALATLSSAGSFILSEMVLAGTTINRNVNTGNLDIAGNASLNGIKVTLAGSGTQRLLLDSSGNLTISGAITIGATLHAIPDSPTQLIADQNNYQAGTGRSMFYRLSSDASRSITGFNPAGGTNQDGELHYFINVGSNNIVLVNESASSTAGNRFLNVTGADITLATNEMAMLVYDNTSARWRVAKM